MTDVYQLLLQDILHGLFLDVIIAYSVCKINKIVFICYLQMLTFVRIELHLPYLGPSL